MNFNRRKTITAVAVATASLLAFSPAAAQAAPKYKVLAEGLVAPLHLSVGSGTKVAVSEAFPPARLIQVAHGEKETRYSAQPGWSVGGIDHLGTKAYFVESIGAGEDPAGQNGALKVISLGGKVSTVTDQLAAYERDNNPDQDNQYGLSDADVEANPDCVAQLTAREIPVSGPGGLDSNPYGLAVKGTTGYIADAGANAVLSVDLKSGAITTVAVLPPQPSVIPSDWAAENGVPACGGLTYNDQPVPTDVVVDSRGTLYVSTLPGGPEDPSLGARGSVYRINPKSGAITLVTDSKVLSPTGLALDEQGKNLYIASLFGGEILKVPTTGGTATPFLKVPMPADVDIKGSTLYATTNALVGLDEDPPNPNGMLVSTKI